MQESQNKDVQLIKYLDIEIIITEQSAKYHGSFTGGKVPYL